MYGRYWEEWGGNTYQVFDLNKLLFIDVALDSVSDVTPRNSRSRGKKSHTLVFGFEMDLFGRIRGIAISGLLALAGAAWGAEDAGARAVQQQLLQRQQQQEALQLRLQQQQRAVQSSGQDAQHKQALDQLQAGQRQRQQELHYRQDIEPATTQSSDDDGTRRAKEEMDRERARQQGQELLRRSETGQ